MAAFHQSRPLLVVWDLHGVLVTGHPADQAAFAQRVGLPADIWNEVRKAYCVDGLAWDQVERGEMTLEDFADELSQE
jgi:hypothetical protein